MTRASGLARPSLFYPAMERPYERRGLEFYRYDEPLEFPSPRADARSTVGAPPRIPWHESERIMGLVGLAVVLVGLAIGIAIGASLPVR